jgi:iron complex transport system substrate-binding protein
VKEKNETAAAAGDRPGLYRRRAQRQYLDAGIGSGQMLEQLGFSLATLPGGLPASHSQGKRHDIVQLGGENLAAGLNGQSLFLFAGDQKDADAIYANPLLAHLPAVAGKRVYPLGTETFRLDYYSALLVLQRLSALA